MTKTPPKPTLSALLSVFSRYFLALAMALAALLPAQGQAQSSVAGSATGPTPYETLAELLENEQTRNQLIQQLRQLAQQSQGSAPGQPHGSEQAKDTNTSGAGQASAESDAPSSSAAPAADAPSEKPSLLSAIPGVGMATRLLKSTEPEPQPSSQAGADAADGARTSAAQGGTGNGQSASASTANTSSKPTTQSSRTDHAEPPSDAGSLPQEIAAQAQAFLAGLMGGGQAAADALQGLLHDDGPALNVSGEYIDELLHLAIVLAVTLLVFVILRTTAKRVFGRMDQWVDQNNRRPHSNPRMHRLYTLTVAVVGALLVDLAAILLSAMAGYGVAVLATGERGDLGDFELAFLNAFLAVEVARALIRTVFSARFEHLRLLPIDDTDASYWNNYLERISWLLGYSVLLLVPVLGALMSPEVGRLTGLVIALVVYAYGVRVIWKHRNTVAQGLLNRAQASTSKAQGTLLRVLSKLWHLMAIAYFTVLLVVSQVDPHDTLSFMTFASLRTLLAVAVGVLVSAVLSILLTRRITLPDDVRKRLPMLETRINAYVPAALKWVRLVILVVVVLVVLDAWQLFSMAEWLSSETGSTVVATLVRVSIVIAFAALIWTVVASIIEHRLSLDDDKQDGAPSARERTLLALFRNATLILIVTMTLLIVLSQIGINIGPLIAGAGVVGLAIGFGAQKLVQDVINGIFIQLENGMNQNDVVEVGGVFGTVEKITIRSVGIRTLDGGYHMIPFSSVDKVSNHMRDFSYHLGEYTVGYRESVDDVVYHLERAFEELMTDPVLSPEVLEDMVVAGVTSLNERGFTVRIMIKTKPGMQWAVQRGYNRLVKKHFNAAGIELPYPHTVVYFGQDKNGDAPPMRVQKAPAKDITPPVMPAGHTPRPLTPADHSKAADVLGNELATVVDEDGNVSSKPGTQAERPNEDDKQEPKKA